MADDAHPPLTFAIMEFFGNYDTIAMKKRWRLELKYEDKTPNMFASQSFLPTFNSKPIAKRWTDFQEAMAQVDADWYFVGGHHGRQYDRDWDGVKDHWAEHCRTQAEVGFFNHIYHEGTWSDEADSRNLRYEVYMTTAHAPADPWQLQPNDNPLFTHIHSDCKGLLLVGCNSLSYKVSRETYLHYFPSAFIVGMSATINGTEKYIKPLLNRKICDDSFFRSPPTRDDDFAECCYVMNRAHCAPGDLRLQFENKIANYHLDEKVAYVRTFNGLEVSRYPK